MVIAPLATRAPPTASTTRKASWTDSHAVVPATDW